MWPFCGGGSGRMWEKGDEMLLALLGVLFQKQDEAHDGEVGRVAWVNRDTELDSFKLGIQARKVWSS